MQLTTASLPPQTTVFVGGAKTLKLRGLGGNDAYSFDFTTPITGATTGGTVVVQGNGPGTTSTISYTAGVGENTQIDYGAGQITDTTGGTTIPAISFSGLAAINEQGQARAAPTL